MLGGSEADSEMLTDTMSQDAAGVGIARLCRGHCSTAWLCSQPLAQMSHVFKQDEDYLASY